MRAWLWQRVPDYCRTPGHMKRAYYDVMRREVLMVAWPLNYVVQGVYWALGRWNAYRMAPSWMDGDLDRLRRENREVLGACAEMKEKLADALQEVDLRTLDYERMKQERDALRDAVNALHDYVHGKRNDYKDISEILNGAMKI